MRAEQPPPGEDPRHSAAWWLEAVKLEERRGELLAAFDVAQRGLAQHGNDLRLKHRAVLALARAGATEEARRRFEQYELANIRDEDVAALGARIAKDVALATEGGERRRLAAAAAERYGEVFASTGGYYPAINAATLWLLAGRPGRARRLAREVLEILADGGEDSYYAAATEGEAQLLLGRRRAARRALERAAARHGGDYGALATTRRQLRTICTALGIDPELLSVLAGPRVVHFCGHRIGGEDGAGRFPRDVEASVAGSIAEVVARHPAGFAYGSLASGADILWAEALLAGGAELHVVLPFARQEFLELSVLPSGGDWGERFDRCLVAATAVDYATNDAFLGDDVLFRYGAELAMGLALLRAQYLDSEARQLAVWDGGPADGAAGTAIDVATWRRGGRPATIVSPDRAATITQVDGDAVERSAPAPVPASPAPATPVPAAPVSAGPVPSEHRPQRIVRALLFGDVAGFSRLTDEQLPVFADRVLGAFAAVVGRNRDQVWHRNTWGDAVYVVLSDARSAAACALDLQDSIAALDLEGEGLPAGLALRLGGHVGPVFPTHDPVLDEAAYMGSHVSRTARIEPVTPPGTVYVTEAFAAALVLDGRREFTSDYVGRMAAAKHYGVLRMYRLRRRGGTDSQGRRVPVRRRPRG